MLAELWDYLCTPCSSSARRLGYLRESVALAARQRRCRVAWRSHLEHSRAALLAAANASAQCRTALILGSGHLLDIPLAELAERFQRVLLVDMLHPWCAKRQVRAYGNVSLIEHDISECVAALCSAVDNHALVRLGQQQPRRFLDDQRIDFVASVNLLSQLPLLPSAWLLRHARLDAGLINDFSLALMQRHLDYLAAFAAPVCLIADAEQISYSVDGHILERTDYADYFQLDRWAYDRWWWEIAPPGELSHGIYARHRVVACRIKGLFDRIAGN